MNGKEIWKNHGYPCMLTSLFCVSVVTLANTYYKLAVPEIVLVLLTIVWVVILRCLDQNKKNVILYVVFSLVCIGGLFLYFNDRGSILLEIKQYKIWMQEMLQQRESKSLLYATITVGIGLLISSIPIYLLQKRLFLRVFMAVISLTLLVILGFLQPEITKLSVVCLLLYLFLVLVETRVAFCYQKKESTSVMTFLLPCVLLLCILLLVFPASKKPMEWKTVKKCINAISDSVEKVVIRFDYFVHPEKKEFSINFAGYTESGTLGGSILDSEEVALSLTTKNLSKFQLYLSGNVKNSFDGRMWEDTESRLETTYSDRELDVLELFYAIDREGLSKEYGDLLGVQEYSVMYEGIATKTLFYPIKVLELNASKRKSSFTEQSANLRFDEIQSKDSSYTFSFIKMNLGSDTMDQFLAHQNGYPYQENQQTLHNFYDNVANKVYPISKKITLDLEDQIKKRRDHIYEEYLSVYDGIPNRVRELAKELTKDCNNDYERCKVLESYFSKYNYSTTPKQPGKGVDLLDYVIFESKEGYCTYYASAFAIMARCVGIPTRFVQGFQVSSSGKNLYQCVVKNQDAHAWPEAYLNGIGWIPFEPTPSYYEERYQTWSTTKKGETTQTITPSIGPSYDSTVYEKLLAKEAEENRDATKTYRGIFFVVGCVFLCLILGMILYYVLRLTQNHRQYQKAEYATRIEWDMRAILIMAEVLGVGIKEAETFQILMKRVCETVGETSQESKMIECYQRLRYNEEEPLLEEQEMVEEFRKRMNHYGKKMLNIREYLRMRILLLHHKKM